MAKEIAGFIKLQIVAELQSLTSRRTGPRFQG